MCKKVFHLCAVPILFLLLETFLKLTGAKKKTLNDEANQGEMRLWAVAEVLGRGGESLFSFLLA